MLLFSLRVDVKFLNRYLWDVKALPHLHRKQGQCVGQCWRIIKETLLAFLESVNVFVRSFASACWWHHFENTYTTHNSGCVKQQSHMVYCIKESRCTIDFAIFWVCLNCYNCELWNLPDQQQWRHFTSPSLNKGNINLYSSYGQLQTQMWVDWQFQPVLASFYCFYDNPQNLWHHWTGSWILKSPFSTEKGTQHNQFSSKSIQMIY